jgi:hypothetical protein
MRPRRRAVCRYGICKVQRHDGGAVCVGVAEIGIYHAEGADVQGEQHLL